MMEKRHHVRVSLDELVTCSGTGAALKARSVDISHRGMRVIVNQPYSFDRIRTITFTLPGGSSQMEIPCRIIREDGTAAFSLGSGNGGSANGGNVTQCRAPAVGTSMNGDMSVGVLFDSITEEQLALVDEFIRQQKEQELLAQPGSEERSIPRMSCSISPVDTAAEGVEIISVDNISTEGLLVSYRGTLVAGAAIQLTFPVPGVRKPVAASATVMYAIDQDLFGLGRAGLRIDQASDIDKSRIRNYILASSANMSVAALDGWLLRRATAPDYQISGRPAVAGLFRRLMSEGRELQGLFPAHLRLYAFRLLSVDDGDMSFSTVRPPAFEDIVESAAVKGTFTIQHGGHFFSTNVRNGDAGTLVWDMPDSAYRLEKRSAARVAAHDPAPLTLSVDSGTFQATLVDSGPGGFRCELALTPASWNRLTNGCQVAYRDGDRLVWGEVRHREEVTTDGTLPSLRIGVESGIRRVECDYRQVAETDWEAEPGYEADDDGDGFESRPVVYRNRRGQRIAAILNATSFGDETTVVVIPPAFGKKKESLAPLSMVLLKNFRKDGRNLVTLRYDGIDRPGESDGSVGFRPRGYEMLHYRMSQGLDDLRTTLDFVASNSYFRAVKIVLVTFSMSALDARKILLEERYAGMVSQWISVMGVPSAQSALTSVLGGIDAIGNYKMGIPTGVCGMMGHLIDMDRISEDIVEHRYAHITEARFDMKHLDTPILWMYGRHDGWIDADEIHDIMTIAAPGKREVLEIPSGHNLRTSDDAIRTFKRITEAIKRTLFSDAARAIGPGKKETLKLIAYERERLRQTEEIDLKQYWQQYLIGSGAEKAGYDFFRNLPPFKSFLRREAELLAVEPGNRVGDFGCGTGIFLETLLEHLLDRAAPVSGVSITAVDLIDDALRKAEAKARGVLSRARPHRAELEFRQMNLEPNRLVPLARLRSTPGATVDLLRDRVEGLTNVVLDQIAKIDPALVSSALRCEPDDDAAAVAIAQMAGSDVATVLAELNRGMRFLGRNLVRADLVPETLARFAPAGAPSDRVPDGLYADLTTADLRFEVLNFQRSGLELALPFADGGFDRVIASLFISYLFNPEDMISELYRVVRPGGRAVVSSMRPDSDISMIFTDFIQQNFTDGDELGHAREMLNEAAGLFELEEEGYFRFYDAGDLETLMKDAGFEEVRITHSLGVPTQVVIATGVRPWSS